jgi:acyl dehydratase
LARGTYFSDFEVGQEFVSVGRTVTEADVVAFAGISGDFNPLHTDATFAAKTPFGQRVAHGMLSAAISTGLGQTLGIFEGTTLALMGQTFQYKGPVFFGDTIRLSLTVDTTKVSSKGGKGVVKFRSDIINQNDSIVITGEWTVLFRDR